MHKLSHIAAAYGKFYLRGPNLKLSKIKRDTGESCDCVWLVYIHTVLDMKSSHSKIVL